MSQPNNPPEYKRYLLTIRIEPMPVHVSRVVIVSSREEAERHAANLSTSVVEEFYVEDLQAILDSRDDDRDLVRRFSASVKEIVDGRTPVREPEAD